MTTQRVLNCFYTRLRSDHKLDILLRNLSTQTKIKAEEEFILPKSFEELPKLSKYQFIRRSLPGGKYHGLTIEKMHEAIRQEVGDISWFPSMFGRPGMVLSLNPADFEIVFRNEGTHPHRRTLETLKYYRKTVRPDIYGEFGSLLTENDHKWQQTRTMVNRIMMKPQTTKLYIPQVDEIAKQFIKQIKSVRDDKLEMPAHFTDLVNQWSLESITFITLNQRLGLLNDTSDNPNAKKLIKLIRAFLTQAYNFEVNPSIWKYYQTKAFKELMQIYDQMTRVILNIVDDAIKEIESQPHKDDGELSILEKLLKVNKKLAVVMCADALIAGVDATSSALLTTLYCLAKNPEKQEKLREEVIRMLPNKDDPLTMKNMKNLPYLRAVIKEGLRMYSPAAGTLRKLDRDVVLSGYRIPKGQEVLMSFLAVSNQEKHYKNSNEFIPERWLKTNTDPQCHHAKDAHPFSYLPFGFGTRMCVGRRFAELELETMLMRIIRNFKTEWHHPDMKIKVVLINFPESDMKFKLIDV